MDLSLKLASLAAAEIQKFLEAQPDQTSGAEGSTRTPSAVGGEKALVASSDLAISVLRCFRPFLQDISIVYRVLETLLNYLDKEAKWEQDRFVEV